MERLGDHFPPEQRLQHVMRSLVPGQVVYLHCQFTKPAKEKYLVIVCADPEVLFFVINTSVHPYIAKRPDLSRCQVKLPAGDHPFLRRNCVINCAEVIRGSQQPDMVKQLASDLRRIRGRLSQAAMADVAQAVRTARTLSAADKMMIDRALAEAEAGDDETPPG
jgi:hypothetical protein